MENRIKECQGDMFADRTPAATMRANQLRLWFASMAYVLMCALRRIGLAGSELARATCGTIRLKLLKIGAQVTISVRRVKIAFASSYPGTTDFCPGPCPAAIRPRPETASSTHPATTKEKARTCKTRRRRRPSRTPTQNSPLSELLICIAHLRTVRKAG